MPQQDEHIRALVRVVALSVTNGNRDAAEEVVKWAYERDDVLFTALAPITVKKEPKMTFTADVDEIYKAYPSCDRNNGGRMTHKGIRNKQQIENLLKKGFSKQHLLNCISRVVNDSSYLKDFTTFLNNIPCEDDMSLAMDLNTSPQPKDDLHF